MATAAYDTVLEQARQLSPDDQERLRKALAELADIHAYDAAIASQTGEELIPFDQAVAEIEAGWTGEQVR